MRMSDGLRTRIIAAMGRANARGTVGKPVIVRYRGKAYLAEQCHGEAHSASVGGMVDHCGVCAPLWGIMVRELDQAVLEHVEYLEGTLIPDLQDSGRDATAEDFERCCLMLRALTGSGK